MTEAQIRNIEKNMARKGFVEWQIQWVRNSIRRTSSKMLRRKRYWLGVFMGTGSKK